MADLRSKLDRLSRDLTKKQIELAKVSGEIIDVQVEEVKKPTEITAEDIINGE